jgi:hypothetical protein
LEVDTYINIKELLLRVPDGSADGAGMIDIAPHIGKVYSPSGAASPETDADIPF